MRSAKKNYVESFIFRLWLIYAIRKFIFLCTLDRISSPAVYNALYRNSSAGVLAKTQTQTHVLHRLITSPSLSHVISCSIVGGRGRVRA